MNQEDTNAYNEAYLTASFMFDASAPSEIINAKAQELFEEFLDNRDSGVTSCGDDGEPSDE